MVTCHGDMSRHVYCTHQFTHESEKHDQTCARPKHELAGVIKRWPVPPRLSKSRPHDAEHPWHGHLPPRVHFDRVLHQLTVALFLVVSQVRRLSVQEIGCATEDEPLRDSLRSRRMITARDVHRFNGQLRARQREQRLSCHRCRPPAARSSGWHAPWAATRHCTADCRA